MYFTLFVTVLITAAFLVVAAYAIAKWIGPRSYNPAKGEPYECGIPTYGTSWLPVHIGYYLFAILFLMFDVETVFLYPWAVVVKTFWTSRTCYDWFLYVGISIWSCVCLAERST